MNDGPWFRNWPSYFSGKMLPSCEPATILVGTQVFTNHHGLTYTLVSVVEPDEAKSQPETPLILSSGMAYLNHPLEDCNVNMVQIDLESTDRAAWQFATQQWGSVSRAFIDCKMVKPHGVTRLNLTVDYDLLPGNVYRSSGFEGEFPTFKFLKTNRSDSAALWWGESLLSMYWDKLSYDMQQIRDSEVRSNKIVIRKGTLVFTPNTSRDIASLEYFNVGYRFIRDNSNSEIIAHDQGDYNLSAWSSTKRYPNIWVPADSLAKSLYSVVLADLGQNKSTILTSPDALQYYTKDFATLTNHTGINTKAGPANDSYENLKGTFGALTLTRAMLVQKYLCQIPRRKATGSLIMAILLANLVLLSACWTVVTFVASTWVSRIDTSANYCVGCLADVSMPLMDLSGNSLQHAHEPVDVKSPALTKVTTSGYAPLPPVEVQIDSSWPMDLFNGIRRKPVPVVDLPH